MHDPNDPLSRAAVAACFDLARARIDDPDPPLGRTADAAALESALAGAICRRGLGVDAAMALVREVVVTNAVALDGPRFVALIPAAPSLAAKAFDAVVGAHSFSPESWLESAGAVAAENQTLRVLADAAGMPEGAGGCFVSGGSAGNLAALAVARDTRGGVGSVVLVSETAHASIDRAAHLLGLTIRTVPADDRGRLVGAALDDGFGDDDGPAVCAVVASAGATNTGAIDDLVGIAERCAAHGAWMHVDAAYGGGALFAPSVRERFAGIERADSLVIDPHKWLFGTLDCGALLYKDPALALPTFRQRASYLDLLQAEGAWNPSDYAFHLTRRARGLPLWFSMVVHGLDAYADAVERVLELARNAAETVRAADHLDLLVEPELSVVVFERRGWTDDDYAGWARRLLADEIAFVVPTRWNGRVVARAVFLHPDTPDTLFDTIVESMR